MDYADFIEAKSYSVDPVGFDPGDLPECLKPFQNDAVRWSTRMADRTYLALGREIPSKWA